MSDQCSVLQLWKLAFHDAHELLCVAGGALLANIEPIATPGAHARVTWMMNTPARRLSETRHACALSAVMEPSEMSERKERE